MNTYNFPKLQELACAVGNRIQQATLRGEEHTENVAELKYANAIAEGRFEDAWTLLWDEHSDYLRLRIRIEELDKDAKSILDKTAGLVRRDKHVARAKRMKAKAALLRKKLRAMRIRESVTL